MNQVKAAEFYLYMINLATAMVEVSKLDSKVAIEAIRNIEKEMIALLEDFVRQCKWNTKA